jgi:hypothetical protein
MSLSLVTSLTKDLLKGLESVISISSCYCGELLSNESSRYCCRSSHLNDISLLNPEIPAPLQLASHLTSLSTILTQYLKVETMADVAEILRGKYPAKEHAKRVAEWIVQNGGKKDGLIYLEAQKLKYNEVCMVTALELHPYERSASYADGRISSNMLILVYMC